MAILEEKEVQIEHGSTDIILYAEYRNGQIDRIYAELIIDGHSMHKNPGKEIYDGHRGETSFYLSLLQALDTSLSQDLVNAVTKLKGF